MHAVTAPRELAFSQSLERSIFCFARFTTRMAALSGEQSPLEQSAASAFAAARHLEQCDISSEKPCCGCTVRCELQRCKCIHRAEVCTSCVPLGGNKCETHAQEAAAASGAAAAGGQPPQSHVWITSPAKLKAAKAAASAAAAAMDGIGEQPACIDGVRQYCLTMRGRAPAAGYSINAEQLHLIEQFVTNSQRFYDTSRELQKEFSAANLESAAAQAALAAISAFSDGANRQRMVQLVGKRARLSQTPWYSVRRQMWFDFRMLDAARSTAAAGASPRCRWRFP